VLFLAAIVAFGGGIAGFGDLSPNYLGLALLLASPGLATWLFSGILQGTNQIAELNATGVVPTVSNTIGVAVFLLVFNSGVNGALCSWGISQMMAAIIALTSVYIRAARTSKGVSFPLRLGLLQTSISFGLRAYLGQILGVLMTRLDFLLVAFFLGVEAVGYYAVATTLAEVVNYVPGSFGIVLYSHLKGLPKREAGQIVAASCRVAFLANLLLALALLILGQTLVKTLFGASFLPATVVLLLRLPGVTLFSLAHIINTYFNAVAERPLVSTGVVLTGFSLSAFLIPLGATRMGLPGVALASTSAYAVAALVCLAAFAKISGIPWWKMLAVRRQDIALFVSLVTKPSAMTSPR